MTTADFCITNIRDIPKRKISEYEKIPVGYHGTNLLFQHVVIKTNPSAS